MPYYDRKVVRRTPKVVYRYFYGGTDRSVTDSDLIHQLAQIKVPATYTRVVITPGKKVEAIGYDGTGKKQYFYSDHHQERARKNKYRSLVFLGLNLGKIMKDVDHLVGQKINQDVLDAIAIRVMLLCNFRVGSDYNEKRYQTYGLSTLKLKHIKLKPKGIEISFNGKKQQLNKCELADRKTVMAVRKLYRHNQERGEEYLFTYEDLRVSPESLNEFLSSYHPEITTKTWRTWYANIRYLGLLQTVVDEIGEGNLPETKTKRKTLNNRIVKEVADELHHTPAVCKRNYLMSELSDSLVEHPRKFTNLLNYKSNPNDFFMDFIKQQFRISDEWIIKNK